MAANYPFTANSFGLPAIPAFLVNKNNLDQTGIVTGIFTKVDWATALFDTTSDFDFTNNRFTPSVAGKYRISASLYMSTLGANKSFGSWLYKNGVAYAWGSETYIGSSTAGDAGSVASVIVDMNGTSDYVEIFCFHTHGSNNSVYGDNTLTSFHGNLISPQNTQNSIGGTYPAFHVDGVQGTTITQSTFTKLTWSNEVFDVTADFASNTFTPTTSGKYLLILGLETMSIVNGTSLTGYIYKNGAVIAETKIMAGAAGNLSAPVATVVDANGTTDYFEAYVFHVNTSPIAMDTAASRTYFTGSRLSS